MLRDSSNSRVFLTVSNNHYQPPHEITDDPQILADRRARTLQFAQKRQVRRTAPRLLKTINLEPKSSSALTPKAAAAIAAPREVTMAKPEEIFDIDAAPMSSDDDEVVESDKHKSTALPTPSSTQQSSNKRPLTEANGNRRSKRSKVSPIEESKPSSQPPSLSQNSNMPSMQIPPLFSSQSSQKKKNTYKKKLTSSWRATSTPESPDGKEEAKLAIPPRLSATPTSASKKGADRLELPKGFSSPIAPPKLFLPSFDETQHDIGADEDEYLELNTIRARKSHKRTRSSSSLSSADSYASIQLDKQTKHRLNTDFDQIKATDIPAGYVRCPSCKRDTLKEGLSFLNNKTEVKDLSRKDTNKFCFEHRMRDAKLAWKEAQYPDSDVATLTLPTRLEKYLNNLIPIMLRERKSFYLDKLDSALANAKGNQRKINQYFSTDVLAFANNGYYGPRGHQQLSMAIASDDKIIKQFRRTEKSDKAFRIANLSRAIDSVLLRELLVMLVQDDMYLTHDEDGEAQARKILEDSEELGILLNGDDNDEVDDMKENDDL